MNHQVDSTDPGSLEKTRFPRRHFRSSGVASRRKIPYTVHMQAWLPGIMFGWLWKAVERG